MCVCVSVRAPIVLLVLECMKVCVCLDVCVCLSTHPYFSQSVVGRDVRDGREQDKKKVCV